MKEDKNNEQLLELLDKAMQILEDGRPWKGMFINQRISELKGEVEDVQREISAQKLII